MLQYLVRFLLCSTLEVTGFSSPQNTASHIETRIAAVKGGNSEISARRGFLKGATAKSLSAMGIVGMASMFPQEAQARYVLDNETGEYVKVDDEDWQTAWRQRLDKAQGMSQQEIFKAARGAGNLDLKDGQESDASKKRRAMSACRDANVRDKANAGSEGGCAKRVFAGEVDFLLDALE